MSNSNHKIIMLGTPLNYRERKQLWSIDWVFYLIKYTKYLAVILAFYIFLHEGQYLVDANVKQLNWLTVVVLTLPAVLPLWSILPQLWNNYQKSLISLRTAKEDCVRKIGKYYLIRRGDTFLVWGGGAECVVRFYDQNTLLDLTEATCKRIIDGIKKSDSAFGEVHLD